MTTVVDKPNFPFWGNTYEADFEADTWTFKMCNERYEVSKGPYALIHNDDYDAMMHEISAERERVKRAEQILRSLRQLTSLCDYDKEMIDKFFDPAPLG